MSLNKLQLEAISALRSGKNVVVAGAAGTGKSHLIKEITALFQKALITGMTGNAAYNIGGQTLHSTLKIGLATDNPRDSASRHRKVMEPIFRDSKLVIVDESSMMSDKLFEFIDIYLREVMRRDCLWGGMQMILVGDMLQLPPVERGNVAGRFFFESPKFKPEDFEVIVLTENFRQSGDVEFRCILDRIAMGEHTDEDIKTLESCIKPVTDKNSTHIFNLRYQVDSHNDEMLAKVDTKPETFKLRVIDNTKSGSNPLKVREMIDKAIKATETRFKGSLTLKTGAFVMTTANCRGKYVNGTSGVVTKLTDSLIDVKLKDGSTIQVERLSIKFDDRYLGTIFINQFPLILAYAITAHRSQGLTLDSLVASVDKTTFAPAQAYVTLSRCRKMEDITLGSIDTRSIFAQESAKDFYKTYTKK